MAAQALCMEASKQKQTKSTTFSTLDVLIFWLHGNNLPLIA
jgi:hypothetical protein